MSERRPDVAVMVAAELFLVLTTLTAVAGFSRLFDDTSWVSPLLAATIVAHVTVGAVRRMGRGLLLGGALSAVVMVLQITWTHYRPTLETGLPTGATRDAIDADLTAAWNLFSDVKAPTEPVLGFVVMATIAIWVVAYLADWAAFRLWSPLESALPGFAIFVFVAFFGDDGDRIALSALFLAALIGFQLFHHLTRQTQEVRWLAGTQRSGTSALTRAGAVVSVIVVLGAVAAGPALPGAEQDPLVDLDTRTRGRDTRVVISPIVDIRGRLVDQADLEAFTVRSSQPSYWRLASLDSFNGQIWGADNKYARASGSLPDDYPVDATVDTLTQSFDITALGAVWLPAAYEPRRILEVSDENISYEPVSGTLIVGRSLESSNGLSYSVESAIPVFDPVALEAAPNAYPQEILDRYLQLPDDFSATATALAFELTAGDANNYEKALSLQNYFRDNFTYDLDVGAGHSNARIDSFLEAGVGYCEQFAGSFAAMARAIGMPARVAVGFTWGERDAVEQDLYRVRGEHAHAWPEVYIPGSGWVPFEPTPTRGAPNAAPWTGVQPAQAGGDIPEEPEPTPDGAAAPPNVPEEPLIDVPTDPGSAEADGAAREGVPRWLKIAALVLVSATALGGLYALGIVAIKRSRSRYRFARAADNRERVNAVWTDTVESLRPLGLEHQPTETIREFAERAGRASVPARRDLLGLSELAVEATYGPREPSDESVEAAQQHREGVAATVQALTTTTDRLKDSLDPRTLVSR